MEPTQTDLKDSCDDGNSSLDLDNMDPIRKAKLEEELRTELLKTEEEIQTLRQVLAARIKHSQELKRKLGIGVWKELQNDLQQSIKSVQDTTAYQKTTETVKLAAEKTTDIFGSLGDSIGRKLVDVKNSTAFKSIEERVGSTISKAGLSSANTSGSSNNNNNNIITSNIRSPDEAVNNLKNEKE